MYFIGFIMLLVTYLCRSARLTQQKAWYWCRQISHIGYVTSGTYSSKPQNVFWWFNTDRTCYQLNSTREKREEFCTASGIGHL